MSQKVQLRLISSPKMSDGGEEDLIRFPRRAREYFGFSNDRVVIGKGYYEVSLKVKQSYKEDVQRLAKMIRAGRISEEEAQYVGFVTRNVQQRVSRKKSEGDVWITDGISSITVGADPEFGLVGESNLLVRGNRVVGHAGKFGSDGPSVEVRPPPSRDHVEVVENIRDILLSPPEAADKYGWIGGASFKDRNRVYWFGGHIHLGRPSQIEPDHAFPVYEKIATALDGLLALPMARFDTPEPWQRRNGCKYNYGKAGDIRADYPEQDRFEYRVLSGLWLVHPTLARIAIGSAKCIAETAYSRLADQNFDMDWATAPASKKGLLKTFGIKGLQEVRAVINRAQPEEITQDQIRSWKRWVRSLDRYDEYSNELKALICLAEAEPGALEKSINLDIRKNWQEEQVLLPKANKKLRTALDNVGG